ncbi:MAG: type II secretion system protein GspK [Candidatus Aceula lacicola]|nr:type II secretion system protein GspK [Candidatus Aceula lacicola]
MKIRRQKLFLRDKSGVIMIVGLWILVVLSILAIGLGRRTRINLALAKHVVAKTKADYLAWAGINYALNQMSNLASGNEENKIDILYQCGISFDEEQTSESVFKDIPLKDGIFDVRYNIYDASNNQNDICYGFQDEERRINLNALNSQNYKVLSYLLVFLGVENIAADEIASSVVDWKDADSDVFNSSFGAEDDFYMSREKPYHCKNLSLDTIEEILLVKSVDDKIFKRLKGYITVFPKQSTELSINVNTASEIVLKSFFYLFADQNPTASWADADSLVAKILQYRQGSDGKPCTADDQTIQKNNVETFALNSIELSIFLSASGKIKEESLYYRIKTQGRSFFLNVLSEIEVVVDRENFSIASWSKK